jgi:hypothetical protein
MRATNGWPGCDPLTACLMLLLAQQCVPLVIDSRRLCLLCGKLWRVQRACPAFKAVDEKTKEALVLEQREAQAAGAQIMLLWNSSTRMQSFSFSKNNTSVYKAFACSLVAYHVFSSVNVGSLRGSRTYLHFFLSTNKIYLAHG